MSNSSIAKLKYHKKTSIAIALINATEEEQEVFHSKLYDFNIPNNINDFNGSNKQYNDSEKLPKEFIRLHSNKIIQQRMKKKDINIDDDEKEIIQQKMKRQNLILYYILI
ncbi:hypothetical protein RhiirA4_453074 [Rhizophagus irregularis]|uniref:Uncharacterized protein n=1 Tax=Rhizophagus irregularis TaxID=588596 RepID=A0A2I1FZK8_9GLOM|nr:hypothetical protein RhiirA4_453074 [Rhizophagus irregularis]